MEPVHIEDSDEPVYVGDSDEEELPDAPMVEPTEARTEAPTKEPSEAPSPGFISLREKLRELGIVPKTEARAST